jgi:acyl-CoA thioesterase YciA
MSMESLPQELFLPDRPEVNVELLSTHMCKVNDVGYHGTLFGGFMLAWLDEAAVAYACQVCETPRMVTVSMDKVEFLKPVRPGQIIKVYGEVINFGTTSCLLKIEARRHSTYNQSEKVVCQTNMKFVRLDGDGEPVPIRADVKIKKENIFREVTNE